MPNKFIVAGFGLIGIQVVEELLDSGVDSSDITVIDPHEFRMNSDDKNDQNSREISAIFSRNRVNKGLSKKELSLENLGGVVKSQTYFWGASCLPPMRFELPNSGYDFESIRDSCSKVTKSIGIQATFSSKSEDLNFPFTQEVMNELPRKLLANKWVNDSQGEIYHSRLAINVVSRNGCTFHGTCFEGCPNNSIWNPGSHRTKYGHEFANMSRINSSVTRVDPRNRVVSTSNGLEVSYDRLFITSGAQKSRSIVSSIYPNKEISLKSSPVVLFPFLVREGISDPDFKSHFVMADLLIPFMDEHGLGALTQVYLPTTEIAGRVLLQTPGLMGEISVRLPAKNLEFLMRHIGIAMMFTRGYELDFPKNKLRRILREPVSELGKVLAKNGAVLLTQPRRYILNHSSHHTGAIYEAEDGIKNAGKNSRMYANLLEQGISLLDASLLTEIPPGPHTLSAATLARLEVDVN